MNSVCYCIHIDLDMTFTANWMLSSNNTSTADVNRLYILCAVFVCVCCFIVMLIMFLLLHCCCGAIVNKRKKNLKVKSVGIVLSGIQ